MKLLRNFGMVDSKGISNHLEQNTNIHVDVGSRFEDLTMYLKIVVGLIYLLITCPDLSSVVGLVSQVMQNPQKPHLDCVKRILRHVKSRTDFGVW